MNKDELLKNISDAIPEATSEEAMKWLSATLQSAIQKAPFCNGCGDVITASRYCKVNVYWGYNSTGKDTDHDLWSLCGACVKKWESQDVYPVCSMCRKTIPEVMAELDAQHPGCTFFGDYETALHNLKTNNHCGLEYAKINGCVICELCYEDYITKLKIPIKAGSYRVWTGEHLEKEGEQRKNRIQEAFNYQCEEDGTRYFYKGRVDYPTAVAIRKASDKENRLISVSYSKHKQSFIDYYNAKHPDDSLKNEVYAQTGDNRYLDIPLAWLESYASTEGVKFDPTDLHVLDTGRKVKMGELELESWLLVDRFVRKS